MNIIFWVILLLLPLSSHAAGIKKISDTEFEYTDDNGKSQKMTIKKPIGTVKHIAVIEKARTIRFFVETSDGNRYLHHEAWLIPRSPEGLLLRELHNRQVLPQPAFSSAQDFVMFAGLGTPPGAPEPARPVLAERTTPLSGADRRGDGTIRLTPASGDSIFIRVVGGEYNIVAEADF